MMGRLVVLAMLAGAGLLDAQQPVVRGMEGARLDSLFRAAAGHGFGGVVMVTRRGDTVLLKGYGLADRDAGRGFAPATLVQIGSNVKDFTRTVILQLAAEGRLALDDSLGRFFPSVPDDKRSITVRQLLDHRAGFPLAIGPDSEAIDRDAFLGRALATPLLFPPGTAERYSNTGYSLLAAIIQQVTARSYQDVVADRIFRPAGMRATGYLLPRFDPALLAHGYRAGRDMGTMLDRPHARDGHWWNLRGNGGMVSTVGDMMRFYAALDGPALLASPESRARVLPPDEPTVLAGSDLTCYFVFGSFPGAGIRFALASNVAESPAPPLVGAMLGVLGIAPEDDGGPSPGDTIPITLPRDGPLGTVAAYFDAYNSGDTTAMAAFVAGHQVPGPRTSPPSERMARYLAMYGDLGRVVPVRLVETSDGYEVAVRGSSGNATFTFVVDRTAPFALRGLRVERR